ncbi:hypothetical protein OG897_27850 [Streptomyces sp. NBC_00237]|uniref:hypothetical protein n=1 Tax=Streptomyces sp. NBC_00237 TaxID=2975687 RepID=UPI002253E350|nr:hypothetical protein [Streptomyces sp. NBC_00237]MCX5205258.1 hypothetical protein [Streptomyces sp. NBC_00237]
MATRIGRSAGGACLALVLAVTLAPESTAVGRGPDAPGRGVPGTKAFEAVAQRVLEHRTAHLVEGADPADVPLPQEGEVRVSSDQVREETAIGAELTERRTALADAREAYEGASTRVAVESVSVTRGRVVVVAVEDTELSYRQSGGGEPPLTAFRSEHRLTFTPAPGSGWQLTGVQTLGDGPHAVNQPEG